MIKKTKESDSRRVVITGLGVVSSLGIGWQDFWKNLLAGKSGISKIESFDTSGYDRHYGGEVKNFDPSKFIQRKKISHMGRASQMAIAAAKLAIEDAGLDLKALPQEEMGVCLGTTMGEPQILENLYVKSLKKSNSLKVNSISALAYPSNSISLNLAHELKLKGNNIVFGNACSASNYALGYSFDLIRSGSLDFMLAGGIDALSQIAFTGFQRLLAMAPRKCQPFDKNRKGMMLGEGAGILALESLENAKKRKANIYAEVLGYGLSCDAYSMTASAYEQILKATQKAFKDAGISFKDIDYISAHGTGTPENDKVEAQAIKTIFKERANKIPVNSIKSMLGHTMGAAAALEAISCCLSIKNSKIPPTINFETKDPECDIDCVPNKAREQKVDIALNSSQAFGGNNACLLLKEHEIN
ncbi:MAG: beta-ketoacyl-[acyl-carrier-protein] synthase family protein [Candidatus Omnitrophica bacterium]|nr:beta-ketoacyl-[acyl-carrier-protein] synthase family protein [Candidatus Omnitrophota bacterium]